MGAAWHLWGLLRHPTSHTLCGVGAAQGGLVHGELGGKGHGAGRVDMGAVVGTGTRLAGAGDWVGVDGAHRGGGGAQKVHTPGQFAPNLMRCTIPVNTCWMLPCIVRPKCMCTFQWDLWKPCIDYCCCCCSGYLAIVQWQ